MLLRICTKAHDCNSKYCILRHPVKLNHISGMIEEYCSSEIIGVFMNCHRRYFTGAHVMIRKVKQNEKPI